jgi:hypothetical protein
MRAATAVVLGLVLASGIGIWLLRQGAIADTEDDDNRLGVVLAEQTARTLQSVDLVLQDLAGQIASLGVHDRDSLHALFGGKDVHEALQQRLSDLPQASALSVLDSTGHFVNQSRPWPTPDYTVDDRDYFRYFASTADPNPYISEPEIGRISGVPTVFLCVLRQYRAQRRHRGHDPASRWHGSGAFSDGRCRARCTYFNQCEMG